MTAELSVKNSIPWRNFAYDIHWNRYRSGQGGASSTEEIQQIYNDKLAQYRGHCDIGYDENWRITFDTDGDLLLFILAWSEDRHGYFND